LGRGFPACQFLILPNRRGRSLKGRPAENTNTTPPHFLLFLKKRTAAPAQLGDEAERRGRLPTPRPRPAPRRASTCASATLELGSRSRSEGASEASLLEQNPSRLAPHPALRRASACASSTLELGSRSRSEGAFEASLSCQNPQRLVHVAHKDRP